jgi:hypothetical protein
MKNLKVEESVEAYFEANTESYRSQILGIVIPQLNDQERIEFYSRLSNRFKENLKVLEDQSIIREKSLNITRNAINIASENVNKLKIHNLRAKILLTFSALLFCLCISAQDFKQIDFRGKTTIEVAKTFHTKCMLSTPTEDIYYSCDFGVVRLFYNKSGLCYKMTIKSGKVITFDPDIFVDIQKDKYGLTYTIQ